MTRPLEQAALNAWAEVDSLGQVAGLAQVLQEGRVGYEAATDAVNAYLRVVRRAEDVQQQLADHDAGVYNAWDDGDPGGGAP